MSNSAARPAVVLVPGAWHPPSVYKSIATKLRAASYETIVPKLPSCDSKFPGDATCQKDADEVRKVIRLLFDEGNDVIVVAHSYGGIPAAGAAHGLSKMSRTRDGKKFGVIGLVYVTAFVVPGGVSLLTIMGGNHAPYVIENQPSQHLSITADPRNVFFNDVSDVEAEHLASQLRPQSLVALNSPAPAAAWAEPEYKGRLGFIKCLKDQALPPRFQDGFTQKSGVEWSIREVDAGHAPFFQKSDDFIKVLNQWVEEWNG